MRKTIVLTDAEWGRAEISENLSNLTIADRGSVHGSRQSRIHLRVQELERAHAIASYGLKWL
jgi:hypothetical protein